MTEPDSPTHDIMSCPSFRAPAVGKSVHLTLKVNLELAAMEAFWKSKGQLDLVHARRGMRDSVLEAFSLWFKDFAKNGFKE